MGDIRYMTGSTAKHRAPLSSDQFILIMHTLLQPPPPQHLSCSPPNHSSRLKCAQPNVCNLNCNKWWMAVRKVTFLFTFFLSLFLLPYQTSCMISLYLINMQRPEKVKKKKSAVEGYSSKHVLFACSYFCVGQRLQTKRAFLIRWEGGGSSFKSVDLNLGITYAKN